MIIDYCDHIDADSKGNLASKFILTGSAYDIAMPKVSCVEFDDSLNYPNYNPTVNDIVNHTKFLYLKNSSVIENMEIFDRISLVCDIIGENEEDNNTNDEDNNKCDENYSDKNIYLYNYIDSLDQEDETACISFVSCV